MSAPTPEQLAEAIRSALTRAVDLRTDGRWLHELAYGLAGRDLDRPTRVRPPADPANPDLVRGRPLDLGLGDDNARHAYTWAGQLLGNGHRCAGDAIVHHRVTLGLDDVERRAPALPWRTVRGDLFATLLTSTTARLRWLAEHEADRGDDQTRRAAWSAANYLIAADVEVHRVLPIEPRAQRQCTGCGGIARKGGTQCSACVSRRYRDKQREAKAATKKGKKGRRTIPVAPRNTVAFEARERRRARGEDFGESVLPRGVPYPEAS